MSRNVAAFKVTPLSLFYLRMKISPCLCTVSMFWSVSTRPKRVWEDVFCLPGHVQRDPSSQANCPISREMSRLRHTQRCFSSLDPHSAMSRARSEVRGSQPRGHRAFWCQMTLPLSTYHASASMALFSPNQCSHKTPPSSFTSGRLLWLYDYIWVFVLLCMYLHHSQLVPINNRARRRQSRGDGGAC